MYPLPLGNPLLEKLVQSRIVLMYLIEVLPSKNLGTESL